MLLVTYIILFVCFIQSVMGKDFDLSAHIGKKTERCERIAIPFCLNMPYNLTSMPNYLAHQDQKEAAIGIQEYMSLVECGCSPLLPFLLCSIYAPMCSDQVEVAIPACRGVCEVVQQSCLPVLEEFNLPWPKSLDCSKLPVPENGLCMEFPNASDDTTVSSGDNAISYQQKNINNYWKVWNRTYTPFKTTTPQSIPSHQCPPKFTYISYSKPPVCAPKCDQDIYYTSSDKEFVNLWMAVWASLSFISTFFTMLTFRMNTKRFRYPERPVVAIAFCCNVCSLAYLVRYGVGAAALSCSRTDNEDMYLVIEGLPSTGCILIFLVLYYFGMAASLWWVVFGLTWYLKSGRKWTVEAIESRAPYFHLLSWAIPAFLTIAAIARRHVDGEELTGICVAGAMDRDAMLAFLVLPTSLCLSTGFIFSVMAVMTLCRTRRKMKREGSDVQKLQYLLIRLAIFVTLYTLPSSTVMISYLYEYFQRPEWQTSALVSALECQKFPDSDCTLEYSIPNTTVFIIRLFLSLLVGVSCGSWVCSVKTGKVWQQCFERCVISRNRKTPNREILYQAATSVTANPLRLKAIHHQPSRSTTVISSFI